MTLLIHSLQSEWLKRKGSLASWLVLVGALFTPSIITLTQILRPAKVPAQFASPDFWEAYFKNSWQSMLALLLPMGIILAVTLVTQLEYKNNAWKQLHTTPQPLTVVFVSKFLVLMALQVQLFILFNVAIFLSAVVTSAVLPTVSFPTEPFPWSHFITESAYFFIDSLPIVAIQFGLSLLFRNFLVAVGTGLLFLVTTLVMLSWEFAFVFPYNYGLLNYLGRFPEKNLHGFALGWFAFVMILSYILYIRKNDKA